MSVRETPMSFGKGPKGKRQIVVGKYDPYDHGQKFPKIKLYVGRKAMEVK